MVAAIGFWFPKQPADTEGNVSSHSATKVFPADDQLTLEWDGTYRGGEGVPQPLGEVYNVAERVVDGHFTPSDYLKFRSYLCLVGQRHGSD